MTTSIFTDKNIQYIKVVVELIPDLPNHLKVTIPFHRKDWINKIKQVPHARWHKVRKHWTIPYSKVELRQFHDLFKGECQYLLSIDSNIPERYSDYFENKFPKDRVTLKNGDTTYFKVFSPKEAVAWRDIIKQVPGRIWNPEEKCWQLPYVKYSFRHLKKHIGKKLSIQMKINPAIPDHYQPPPKLPKTAKVKSKPIDLLNVKQKKAIIAIEEKLIMERKSWRTIKSYKTHLIGLFRYYPNTLPSQISAVQIQKYVLHKIKDDNIHERTQGQMINAFAAFYKRLLGQEDRLSLLKRPKKLKDLPNVFSKQEIERLLNSVHNIKHKAILMLVYSAGLRKSELINLRKEDILFERKCIFVKAAKGKKDRYVMLSEKAATFIKRYLGLNDPKYWLFQGQYGGQYSETSIQMVFTNAKRQAKVNPYVTFHGLRHSFATHLVENNVPLHVVKDLLGHQSLKTTQVYLHVSDKMRRNIQSPLDGLSI